MSKAIHQQHHFQRRAAAYTMHGFANGRVEVLPPHAISFNQVLKKERREQEIVNLMNSRGVSRQEAQRIRRVSNDSAYGVKLGTEALEKRLKRRAEKKDLRWKAHLAAKYHERDAERIIEAGESAEKTNGAA